MACLQISLKAMIMWLFSIGKDIKNQDHPGFLFSGKTIPGKGSFIHHHDLPSHNRGFILKKVEQHVTMQII